MTQEKLTIYGSDVVIDSENLKFNESTLNEYIMKEAGFYDNFGYFLAKAERALQRVEMAHEKLYAERFAEAKEIYQASDKLAEAKAKADPDVNTLRDGIVDARYMVNRIKRHLLAWDKNHENAQSMGHMLRKEMDKLNAEIYSRSKYFDGLVETDHRVEGLAKEIDKAAEKSSSDDSFGFEDNLSKDNLF